MNGDDDDDDAKTLAVPLLSASSRSDLSMSFVLSCVCDMEDHGGLYPPSPVILDDATLIPTLLTLVQNKYTPKTILSQYLHVLKEAIVAPDASSWTAFDTGNGIDILIDRMEIEMDYLFGSYMGESIENEKNGKDDVDAVKKLSHDGSTKVEKTIGDVAKAEAAATSIPVVVPSRKRRKRGGAASTSTSTSTSTSSSTTTTSTTSTTTTPSITTTPHPLVADVTSTRVLLLALCHGVSAGLVDSNGRPRGRGEINQRVLYILHRLVIQSKGKYPILISRAIGTITFIIDTNPSSVGVILRHSIGTEILKLIQTLQSYDASPDLLCSIPSILASFCLTDDGIDSVIQSKALETFFQCIRSRNYLAPDKHCFESDTLNYMGSKIHSMLGRRDKLDKHIYSLIHQHLESLVSIFSTLLKSKEKTSVSHRSKTLQSLYLYPFMSILSRLCGSKKFVQLFTTTGTHTKESNTTIRYSNMSTNLNLSRLWKIYLLSINKTEIMRSFAETRHNVTSRMDGNGDYPSDHTDRMITLDSTSSRA